MHGSALHPSIIIILQALAYSPSKVLQLTYVAPLLEPDAGVIEYENVMFRGGLNYQNIYKGAPHKKLAEAWLLLARSEFCNPRCHVNSSGVLLMG